MEFCNWKSVGLGKNSCDDKYPILHNLAYCHKDKDASFQWFDICWMFLEFCPVGNAAIMDKTSHCFTCWLFLLSSFCSVGSLQNILLSRRAGFAACKGQRCLGKKGENGPAGYFHALTNVQEVTIQKYQSIWIFL